MKLIPLMVLLAFGIAACGVKSQLMKPGVPAKQQTEERDPSMPPQPLGK